MASRKDCLSRIDYWTLDLGDGIALAFKLLQGMDIAFLLATVVGSTRCTAFRWW